MVKVTPRRAQRFVKATGKLTKTDRTDAVMLARLGATPGPEARLPESEMLRDLGVLQVARLAG